MINLKIAILVAILLEAYGGYLSCPPTYPEHCTVFVSEYVAFDLYEDPWGNHFVKKWVPALWAVPESGQ